MVTLGPNLVKNLDFCLLLGIVSYNSSDITHSDFIQWVLSAIDVFWDCPNIFYPKLGFLGKNLWLKFGFWFTFRLWLKQLVWCILISFTDSCIFFFRWVHSFIACFAYNDRQQWFLARWWFQSSKNFKLFLVKFLFSYFPL